MVSFRLDKNQDKFTVNRAVPIKKQVIDMLARFLRPLVLRAHLPYLKTYILDPRPLLGLRASKALGNIHIDRSQNLAIETSKRMLD